MRGRSKELTKLRNANLVTIRDGYFWLFQQSGDHLFLHRSLRAQKELRMKEVNKWLAASIVCFTTAVIALLAIIFIALGWHPIVFMFLGTFLLVTAAMVIDLITNPKGLLKR